MEEVQDELDPDEGENQGEGSREVHEPVEQAGNEEEQGTQAKQREGIGHEDYVGVPGNSEHGRD